VAQSQAGAVQCELPQEPLGFIYCTVAAKAVTDQLKAEPAPGEWSRDEMVGHAAEAQTSEAGRP
jgi:hypothetical protein